MNKFFAGGFLAGILNEYRKRNAEIVRRYKFHHPKYYIFTKGTRYYVALAWYYLSKIVEWTVKVITYPYFPIILFGISLLSAVVTNGDLTLFFVLLMLSVSMWFAGLFYGWIGKILLSALNAGYMAIVKKK